MSVTIATFITTLSDLEQSKANLASLGVMDVDKVVSGVQQKVAERLVTFIQQGQVGPDEFAKEEERNVNCGACSFCRSSVGPDQFTAEEDRLARENFRQNKIPIIVSYRKRTGLGLVDSKRNVERIAYDLGYYVY